MGFPQAWGPPQLQVKQSMVGPLNQACPQIVEITPPPPQIIQYLVLFYQPNNSNKRLPWNP